MPVAFVSPDRDLAFLEVGGLLLVAERGGLAVALRRFLADGRVLSWRISVGRLSHLAKLLVLVWCGGG
ncbi:MAG: hypothetical protein DRJ69_01720 [Thermoprotei archaeon]|nr:MAG: hypothetical protein DRJ69_01720 [Thermoprotei archaeon]